MQKNRIDALSYTAYGACAALLVMAYISYVTPAKAALNASIGIILAVILAVTTAYVSKQLGKASELVDNQTESVASLKKAQSQIAHDVRNSLAVIKMDAEAALLRPDLPEEIKETLNQVNMEADKINQILS
ncbi:MAG: hypothetical protein HYV68_02420 [Candidatus Taylorbacteria bacterium]|nr:hypothetical protein [Candidatus Taylorbacteria bacterium]